MKKLIIIVAALILTLTACGKQAPDPAETSEPVEPVYRSEQTGMITVGIQIGEESYYSTFADAEISYIDDEIVDIVIYDPTLLTFRASEDWTGGYYVHSYEEIQKIIEQLEDLRGVVTEEKLNEIIEALQHGIIMTEAEHLKEGKTMARYNRSEESSKTAGGVGFCGLLAIAFIVLKLTGVIDWGWGWVLSPIWIPLAIVDGICAVVLIAVLVKMVDDEVKKRRP